MSSHKQVLDRDDYFLQAVASGLNDPQYAGHFQTNIGDVVVFSGQGKPNKLDYAEANQTLEQLKRKEQMRVRLAKKLALKIENK